MAKGSSFKKMVWFMLMTICVAVTMVNAQRGPAMAPAPFPFEAGTPMLSPGSAGTPMLSPGSAGAPMPAGLDCTDSFLNMSACLTYVEEGSNVTVPEKGCCPGLASLVDNQPICLCQLLSSGEAFGVKIDTTKALILPTSCKLQTPPVSLCSVLGIPVASPMGPSPSPSSGGPLQPGFTPTASPPTTNAASTTTRAAAAIAAALGAVLTLFIF